MEGERTKAGGTPTPLLDALIVNDTEVGSDGKTVKRGMAFLVSLAQEKLTPGEFEKLKSEIEEDLRSNLDTEL